eukprot:scaffold4309_cov71-Skeletonema_menzelii.AAC.1
MGRGRFQFLEAASSTGGHSSGETGSPIHHFCSRFTHFSNFIEFAHKNHVGDGGYGMERNVGLHHQ